jgi:hypothetical protein
MIWNALLRVIGLGATTVVESGDEPLRAGRIRLVGQLRAQTVRIAPLSHRPCAGFEYRATYLPPRARGTQRRTFHSAVCVADQLQLQVGSLSVRLQVAQSNADFGPEAHRALAQREILGFLAREEVLELGQTVQVRGWAQPCTGGWEVRRAQITQLADAAS